MKPITLLRKHILAVSASALLAASPLVAHATAITQGGGPIILTFDNPVSGHPDVTAAAILFNFNYVSSTQLTFEIDIANTTNNVGVGAYTNDRLTSFGWVTAPVTSSGTSTSTIFTTVSEASIPSLNQINLCLFSGQNCAGGAFDGLESTDLATANNPAVTGVFQVTLNFAAGNPVPPLDFSDFGVKFQTSATSYEFLDSGVCVGPNCPVPTPLCTAGVDCTSVPEPASLALLGTAVLGLGGLGALRRRRKGKDA